MLVYFETWSYYVSLAVLELRDLCFLKGNATQLKRDIDLVSQVGTGIIKSKRITRIGLNNRNY